MSTSDQQGNQPLTRKQLREIRLTGATPVIGEDEAAAAAKKTPPTPVAPLPRAAEPAEVAPALAEVITDPDAAPLTRRQARTLERLRTASVPVIEPEKTAEPESEETEPAEATAAEETEDSELVSAVPAFAPVGAVAVDAGDRTEDAGDRTEDAAEADDAADEAEAAADEADADVETDAESESDTGAETTPATATETSEDEAPVDDDADDEVVEERPIVSPAFGRQVLGEQADVPAFAPSFDDLITSDSGGSNRAPNTLVFTHPGEGSLSGPVASTGEILITGSYDLPEGLGSQGHAHGTTDGKDIDAVLIDGELPPASSPTPIAASSAVSTIRPAGEVIRPPAPEKGNKLMLTLAITAGGLALLVAAALVVAFTTNVLG
ncbi:hypothetical protein KEC56_09830 [Microbacterium sp. YMB-B2]|uniref:Uncharacterized protein n=1 Tax=Microbacterium tenebrionis TaxID=2830665 RepID=A0A9X1LQ34_9MICO|nr:hypothetical protein [Microbacterium tenebrionis]MCC2029815.1 hypothetical protein [Microbacterium tenebrionis]